MWGSPFLSVQRAEVYRTKSSMFVPKLLGAPVIPARISNRGRGLEPAVPCTPRTRKSLSKYLAPLICESSKGNKSNWNGEEIKRKQPSSQTNKSAKQLRHDRHKYVTTRQRRRRRRRRRRNYREKIGSQSARSADALGSRIIGGEKATIEKYPFAVSLQNNGTFFGHQVEHFCGGGIVGKKWIITSAQCALRIHVKSFHVRTGSACYHMGGVIYGVKAIVVHPAFNVNNYDYDVALVELSENIKYDETTQPIPLPKLYSEIQDGAQVLVLGWGASVLLGPVSNELLCSTMQKINNEDCQQANGADLLTHRMFCALSDHASACVGDSGSPLIFNDALFGITSWSRSCQLQYPTTYTAISAVEDWIIEVMQRNQ
ncbi:trypsin 3A1 [Halictus rubicundus]|uniref:trypsin 3A1 n=1 Tax=Halictus rubicundus TaxID=77578 RepID=UPI00403743BC